MDTINTFSGGMNKDLDKSLIKPHQAYNIENFRLVSKDGVSTGALENVMGNILSTTIPSISNMYFIQVITPPAGSTASVHVYVNTLYSITYVCGDTLGLYNAMHNKFCVPTSPFYLPGIVISFINNTIVIYSLSTSIHLTLTGSGTMTTIPAQPSPRIIGYANIRQTTVLFTTNCIAEDDATINSIGYGQIWKLTYDDTQNIPSPTLTLLYNNLLSFSDFHPIEALGRFENDVVQKVYWVDDFNYFRFCNIADPNLITYNPSMLDAINDSILTIPTLNSVINGGFYKAGVVQYAYQLYSQYGSQTVFSSCSNTIHIVADSESAATSNLYSGSPITTDCGKSVVVDIKGIDPAFSNIRVVAVFWDTLNTTPVINYVYDDTIPPSGTLQVKDNGVISYGELTAAEFLSQGGALVAAKTLATKYDYLFLGNIKQPSWDIDFDARAYRFDKYGNAIVKDASGGSLNINTSLPNWGVPLNHDCINPFNQDSSLTIPYQCTQDSTATYWTFGGTGPNISYRFNVDPFIGYVYRSDGDNLSSSESTYINNAGSPSSQNLNSVTYPNDSFASEASPEID